MIRRFINWIIFVGALIALTALWWNVPLVSGPVGVVNDYLVALMFGPATVFSSLNPGRHLMYAVLIVAEIIIAAAVIALVFRRTIGRLVQGGGQAQQPAPAAPSGGITMQKFVFIGTGVWAIVHSTVIGAILTANFAPEFSKGVDEAIISTVIVMGVLAISTIAQLCWQWALASHHEAQLSRLEKVYDGITTFLPLATILFCWWYMSGFQAKVAWWPVLQGWVFWITLAGTGADVYNGIKGFRTHIWGSL